MKTVGSLFAGIGGFDLGFERAGFAIKWQVEIDEYASRVLAKHWPGVRRYGDIRAIYWGNVEFVDVLCGGFPCQPHSLAGARRASEDERDLWDEFHQAIRILGPRWVVAENVPGLLSSESGRFFGRVLGDLAASGYDAEWDCIPASACGADDLRDRVWIVAYPQRDGLQRRAFTTAPRGEKPRAQQLPRLLLARARDEVSAARVWRMAHGVQSRMDVRRNIAIGNSVDSRVVEWIAHRIKEADASVMREAIASGVNHGSEAP